jgi:hypothetical protein
MLLLLLLVLVVILLRKDGTKSGNALETGKARDAIGALSLEGSC